MPFDILIYALDFAGGQFKIVGLALLVVAIGFGVRRKRVKRCRGDIDFATAQRNTALEHLGGNADVQSLQHRFVAKPVVQMHGNID